MVISVSRLLLPVGSKSKQPDLDVMVKNLANALMAEISKMKSSSSKGAVSSSGAKKASSTVSSSFLKLKGSSWKGAVPSTGGKKPSSTASTSSVKKSTVKSSLDKNGASSSIKTKVCVFMCVCIHVRDDFKVSL